MKILLINDYESGVGGAESYLNLLSKLLKKNGYEVIIFGSSKKPKSIISFFTRWFSFYYYFAALNKIREFKPDVVHVHNIARQVSPSVIIAAKKKGLPIVMTTHDFYYVCPKTWMIFKDDKSCKFGVSSKCLLNNCKTFRMGIYNYPLHWLNWLQVNIQRKILKKHVDLFISPSKILSYWIKKSLNLENVIHIPNFVESNTYKLEKNTETFLLFVGRLSKEKGVESLIRAMNLVIKKFPNIKLKIVGKGPEKEKLTKLSNYLGICKNVDFLGFVSNEKLQILYQNCYTVVMPSIWMENNPIVGLETIAHGKPLIGSNIGGMPEIIQEGENGCLFSPKKLEDIANKITKIISDKNLADKMGKNAKTMHNNHYSPDVHFKRLMTAYTTLLSKHK